jgi:hypothetical protein
LHTASSHVNPDNVRTKKLLLKKAVMFWTVYRGEMYIQLSDIYCYFYFYVFFKSRSGIWVQWLLVLFLLPLGVISNSWSNVTNR